MKKLILLSFMSCLTLFVVAQTNKEVIDPFTESSEGYIDPDQRITYQINFQNTGTGRINYMTILDTLDDDLDINTVVFENSSHLMIPAILDGKVLRFNLPSIQLPDSSMNEPESHGFVVFSVVPKPGLPAGTLITNMASIYFETKPRIKTNSTLNTLIAESDTVTTNLFSLEEKRGFSVYPNPFIEEIQVAFSHPNTMFEQLIIHDITGRKIFSANISGRKSIAIDAANFPAGIYIYRLTGKEMLMGRLVKR